MTRKRIRRNQRDTVFCILFKEKKELLQLYNAVNDTDYTNPEDLEITTLENAVYMNMKNDVSCCLDMNLQLYEQQSTINPNMPVRFLQYIAEQLGVLLVHKTLYSRKAVALPTPKFFVFYNGTDQQPEKKILRLSDNFTHREEPPALELVVTQLNINPSYNEELKKKCPVLLEYMEYVNCIRKYKRIMPLEEAVSLAVDECIQKGILKEFLLRNKAMAVKMSIYEFDEEQYRKDMYAEAYADGETAGYTKGEYQEKRAIALKMKEKGISEDLVFELTGLSAKELSELE